jgi:hypothetical protein
MTVSVETFRLGNGDRVRLVHVRDHEELDGALDDLGPTGKPPAIILVGGAANISETDRRAMQRFFEDLLVEALDEAGVVVVDGGTDDGVMRLIGAARSARGARFRLVGVAAEGTISLPGSASNGKPSLARGHPEFVIVPGDRWGDESPWMREIADRLSGRRAPILIVNGGAIALAEAEHGLAEGRTILAVAGSGRAADQVVAGGRVTTIQLGDDRPSLTRALRVALGQEVS